MDSLIDFVMYKSYCKQRDDWFDPKTCNENILKGIKDLYPDWERYEEKYKKEKKNV